MCVCVCVCCVYIRFQQGSAEVIFICTDTCCRLSHRRTRPLPVHMFSSFVCLCVCVRICVCVCVCVCVCLREYFCTAMPLCVRTSAHFPVSHQLRITQGREQSVHTALHPHTPERPTSTHTKETKETE